MSNEIQEKIMAKRKTNVNLTIDISLLKALGDYKEKHKIEKLSPMVNEILWEWLEEQEKKKENADRNSEEI